MPKADSRPWAMAGAAAACGKSELCPAAAVNLSRRGFIWNFIPLRYFPQLARASTLTGPTNSKEQQVERGGLGSRVAQTTRGAGGCCCHWSPPQLLPPLSKVTNGVPSPPSSSLSLKSPMRLTRFLWSLQNPACPVRQSPLSPPHPPPLACLQKAPFREERGSCKIGMSDDDDDRVLIAPNTCPPARPSLCPEHLSTCKVCADSEE